MSLGLITTPLFRLATAVMPRGIQNLPTEGEFGVITGDPKRQGVLRNWYAPDRWPRWLVYVFATAAVRVTVFLRLTIGEVFSQRPLFDPLCAPHPHERLPGRFGARPGRHLGGRLWGDLSSDPAHLLLRHRQVGRPHPVAHAHRLRRLHQRPDRGPAPFPAAGVETTGCFRP